MHCQIIRYIIERRRARLPHLTSHLTYVSKTTYTVFPRALIRLIQLQILSSFSSFLFFSSLQFRLASSRIRFDIEDNMEHLNSQMPVASLEIAGNSRANDTRVHGHTGFAGSTGCKGSNNSPGSTGTLLE